MNVKGRAIVRQISYDLGSLDEFKASLEKLDSGETSRQRDAMANTRKLLLDYPTVYIIHDTVKSKARVYVGESRNIVGRTRQHMKEDIRRASGDLEDRWIKFQNSDSSEMIVIGHSLFNKSLTLDIENRLMLYLGSVDSVEKLENRRENQQGDYYTRDQLDAVFTNIWKELRSCNEQLFPAERVIRDSALFKASPFHKLTPEQLKVKDDVVVATKAAIDSGDKSSIILIEGEAGSGKTVLLSSLFFELYQDFSEGSTNVRDAHIVVNHEEQLKVYQQIAKKLGIGSKDDPRVWKPATFIKRKNEEEPVDLVVVDEAHLLLTQGNQAYRGDNQLMDLASRARVLVVVFDQSQILSSAQWWESDALEELRDQASNRFKLENQMRIDADVHTVEWIRKFVHEAVVDVIPVDEKGYDLRVFEDPRALRDAIREKSENRKHGLSRLLATYDWEYTSNPKNRNPHRDDGNWGVSIGEDFFMPWNREIIVDRRGKNKISNDLAWAEQPQTIDEIGSHFTIQGFDLNYAGVILGPSIQYRNGRVTIVPDESSNSKATQNRTLSNGEKESFGLELLRNELNVLMTRGVHGLYVYAVDDALRQKLKEAYASRDEG